MKKLFVLIAFLSFSVSFAQSSKGMVKIDQENNYAEAFQVDSEPELKRIITNFQVTSINGDKARIIVRGKKYEVSVAPQIDAGYVLQVDREYTICLERDMDLVYQFQTRGQNRTLPAKIIWFTVSKDQLLRDQVQLDKFVEEGPGYDRSPRHSY